MYLASIETLCGQNLPGNGPCYFSFNNLDSSGKVGTILIRFCGTFMYDNQIKKKFTVSKVVCLKFASFMYGKQY